MEKQHGKSGHENTAPVLNTENVPQTLRSKYKSSRRIAKNGLISAFSDIPFSPTLKAQWDSGQILSASRNDLFNACVREIYAPEKYKQLREYFSDDEEMDRWVWKFYSIIKKRELSAEDSSQSPSQDHCNLLQFLLYSGVLVPILWEDWGIDRNEKVVSTKLGIKGFTELQELVETGVNGPLTHLHLGPGDGTLMRELRQKDSRIWTQLGIGDRLYFSLEKILQKFARYPDSEVNARFIKLLALFVTRQLRNRFEFEKRYGDGFMDLNSIYEILSTNSWIHEYYDIDSGRYMAAEEFEEEFPQFVTGEDRLMLDQWIKSARKNDRMLGRDRTSLFEFYEHVFDPTFVYGILRLINGPNLNFAPSVLLDGFIYGKFENIHEFIPPHSLAIIHGCRSDSHLPNKSYLRHVYTSLALLKPGGIYLSDGLRQSYTRIYRMKEILPMIEDLKNQFRASVVVDKRTHQPLSLFIERQSANGFYTFEQLRSVFEPEKVELVPLDEMIRSTELVEEDEDRRKLLDHENGNIDVFKQVKLEVRKRLSTFLYGSSLPQQILVKATREVLKEFLSRRSGV